MTLYIKNIFLSIKKYILLYIVVISKVVLKINQLIKVVKFSKVPSKGITLSESCFKNSSISVFF